MKVSDNQVFLCGYTAASPVWSVRNIISQHYVHRHRSAETQRKMAKPHDTFKEVAVMQGWKRLLNVNYCYSWFFLICFLYFKAASVYQHGHLLVLFISNESGHVMLLMLLTV